MVNKKFNKLDSPITPEQIRKCDLDIATIKSLVEYANSTGNILILHGGYATEAHCGGKITRPHDDIDVHFVLLERNRIAEVFSFVESVTKKEGTKWKLRNNKGYKVEYLEDNASLSFFNKRRLEFVVHKKPVEKYNFVKKNLIDSKGNKLSVNVIELNEFIASKIHKLYLIKDGVDTDVDRHPDDRDIYDLKRLLKQKDFNTQDMLLALRNQYLSKNDNNEKAIKTAKIELDYVKSLFKFSGNRSS